MPDMGEYGGAWAALASVIVGFFVYLGTRATARATRDGQRRAEDLEEDATAITGYATLVADIQKDRQETRDRLDTAEKRIRQQDERIADVEKRLEKFQRMYRDAIKYIISLRRIIITNLPGYVIPEPPESLMIDIDGGHNDGR